MLGLKLLAKINLLLLVITVTVFIQVTLPKNIDYLSPLFEQTGDKCPLNPEQSIKQFCIPFKPITFDHIFNKEFTEHSLKDYMTFLSMNSYYKVKLETSLDQNKNLVLRAGQTIYEEQIIYFFNQIDNFCYKNISDYDFFEFEEYKKHAEFPKIPWERQEHKFNFALLYHLYWSEKSVYQHFFKFLPAQPDIPLYTLTHYEMQLLQGDTAFEHYMINYQILTDGYKDFQKMLNKYWTDDMRESFFKFDRIPYEDYVYVDFIRNKMSYYYKNKTDNETYQYIPFGLTGFQFQFEKQKIGLQSRPQKGSIYDVEEYILATEDIEQDEPLYIPYTDRFTSVKYDDNTDEYFMKFGIIPEENERDCIVLEMLDANLANQYGAPTHTCISLYNEKLLMYHAVGNLINMNQKEYDDCNALVKANELHFINAEQEKKFIFDVCPHPIWKKFNVWDAGLESIDDQSVIYKKKIKKTKRYIEFRKKNSKSTKNGELILKYLEKKRELLKDIKYYVEALAKSPSKFKTIYNNLHPAGFDPNPYSEGNIKKHQEHLKQKEQQELENQAKQKEQQEMTADSNIQNSENSKNQDQKQQQDQQTDQQEQSQQEQNQNSEQNKQDL